MNGLKDMATTIPGICLLAIVFLGLTAAMLKGVCSFDQWWQAILIILASIGGGGLLLANTKTIPPPSQSDSQSPGSKYPS